MFNINDLEQEGYHITSEDVLRKYNQETIFGLIFNEQPDLSKKYCSPIRKDKEPGCFFMYKEDILFFVDFANITKKHFSCFDLVREYFKLNSYRDTLHYILNGKIESTFKSTYVKSNKSKKTIIQYKKRPFLEVDRIFWSQFGITVTQLLKDKVYAIEKYRINQYLLSCYDLAYAYTDFSNNHVKIYRPNKKGKYKFTTNCKAEDIGCLTSANNKEDYIVITKSYKDCRVIKNFGYNCVWIQNEGMKPKNLYQIVSYYKNIYVFYDNDEAGIKASELFKDLLKDFHKDVHIIRLPDFYLDLDVTDISDLYKSYGKNVAKDFLLKHITHVSNTKNF